MAAARQENRVTSRRLSGRFPSSWLQQIHKKNMPNEFETISYSLLNAPS
jgi:hypothetical protein